MGDHPPKREERRLPPPRFVPPDEARAIRLERRLDEEREGMREGKERGDDE